MDRFEGFADTQARFFKALAKNQSRAWFAAHKAEYEKGWHAPMKALLAELRDAVDAAFPHCELAEPKVFRIARDVRFAKDKSPYKTHIGGYIATKRAGRVEEAPFAIYFHVGQDALFAAAGHYTMDAPALAKYRAAVADAKRGADVAKRIAKLVKKGYGVVGHETLQRVPKGFAPDHPRAELLKFKGLIARFPPLDAKLLTSRALIKALASGVKEAAPLVEWLVFATA